MPDAQRTSLTKSLTGSKALILATTTIKQKESTACQPMLKKEVNDVQSYTASGHLRKNKARIPRSEAKPSQESMTPGHKWRTYRAAYLGGTRGAGGASPHHSAAREPRDGSHAPGLLRRFGTTLLLLQTGRSYIAAGVGRLT